MRLLTIPRLLAVILLLGGVLSAPLLDAPPANALTRDSGKDEGKGNDKEKDNGNRGKSDEKKAEKDKDKDKGKNAEDDDKRGATIGDSGGYRVEVDCIYDDTAGTSTCTFTGIVPEGGKKINHMDVSQETVCAGVVGGEYKPIEADPHTGVTGYQTKGSNDSVTLVLEGHVVPGGTATYWIKAASSILPVTGEGLECSETFALQPQTPEAATSPPATPTPTTGELVVLIYRCTDVPEDRAGYDWFRLCDSEGGVHGLELAPVSEFTVEPQLVKSDASGDATFSDLEPGLYSLDLAGGTWCKALSDNVDPEGNVIIEIGQRTTVYGFLCEETPAA